MTLKSVVEDILRRFGSVHRPGTKPNVFLLSTPRSGSTWLMEMIASERHMKPCNEPFDLRSPKVRQTLGIDDWSVLADPASLPAIERHLSGFMSARPQYGFRNPRPGQRNYHFLTNRIVFKLLFACENQVPWLRDRFGAQIVVLVRHPIPVSLSREELPRLQALANSDYAGPLTPEQRRLVQRIVAQGSWLEKAMLDWSLQNRPLLSNLDQLDLLVTYEQMVLEPEIVIDKLLSALDLEDAERIRKSAGNLSGSVSKSSGESVELLEQRSNQRMPLLTKWRARVTDEQTRSLLEIPAALDIDIYAADSVLPAERYLIPGNQITSS